MKRLWLMMFCILAGCDRNPSDAKWHGLKIILFLAAGLFIVWLIDSLGSSKEHDFKMPRAEAEKISHALFIEFGAVAAGEFMDEWERHQSIPEGPPMLDLNKGRRIKL